MYHVEETNVYGPKKKDRGEREREGERRRKKFRANFVFLLFFGFFLSETLTVTEASDEDS